MMSFFPTHTHASKTLKALKDVWEGHKGLLEHSKHFNVLQRWTTVAPSELADLLTTMPVLSSQQQQQEEAQLDTAFNFNSTVHGGGLLVSESCSYQVQSFLGQGTFGTVAKYVRINDMKSVAIKMMMNTDHNYMQAKLEVAALKRLQSLNPDRCNIVRWYEDFVDQGHICLVFEHLDRSLFDYMKERQFHPLPLKHIRPIVHQLANALHHLKAAKIIHADLKLENVMLVNQQQEPFRVKVIDFGLSAPESGHAVGSYVQSRPYRSPEVILGLTLSWTIDMWSLGCIAAFLYLGHLLYFGNSEYDVIRNITQVQGQPPDRLLSAGCKTDCFFQRNGNYLWKLKTPEQFQRETGITATKQMSYLSSLNDLLHTRLLSSYRGTDRYTEKKDVCMFVDVLKEMLQLDVAKRITPLQLMQHQFTSLGHITHLYPYSHYVRSSVQVMNACQMRGKAVRASRRQGTALKSQQHLCHIITQFNQGFYNYIIATDEQSLADPTAAPQTIAGKGKKKKNTEKGGKAKDNEYGVSRGVDFQNVASVINFDFPTTVESYIHRVGRTARADNPGTALSFISHTELALLSEVDEALTGDNADSVLKPYEFKMEEIEGFRYRCRDAMRSVTKQAVREARLKEIKQELLNSEKLKTYFEDNPRDLQLLRHDKDLHPAVVKPHLRNVPEYLIPESLRGVVNPMSSRRRRKRKETPKPEGVVKTSFKKNIKGANPLKSFRYSGGRGRKGNTSKS